MLMSEVKWWRPANEGEMSLRMRGGGRVVVVGVRPYDFITPTAMPVMTQTTTAKMTNAHKHRIAHFLSVRLKHSINSFRSASVFVGSQFSGAFKGEKRTMIPASQNIGKTGREQMISILR